MRTKNRVDLINEQIRELDILCGDVQSETLGNRFYTVHMVYDYTDFDEDDLYIEIPNGFVEALVVVIKEAGIKCDIVTVVPEDCNLVQWSDSMKIKKGLRTFKISVKKACSIIRTNLKQENIYYLLSDIQAYGKRGIKVEVMVLDTREDD